jgi:hypothetical protein
MIMPELTRLPSCPTWSSKNSSGFKSSDKTVEMGAPMKNRILLSGEKREMNAKKALYYGRQLG